MKLVIPPGVYILSTSKEARELSMGVSFLIILNINGIVVFL